MARAQTSVEPLRPIHSSWSPSRDALAVIIAAGVDQSHRLRICPANDLNGKASFTSEYDVSRDVTFESGRHADAHVYTETEKNKKSVKVTCIAWATKAVSGPLVEPVKKKKKHQLSVQRERVLLLALSDGSVRIYSPSNGCVVGTLMNGHESSIGSICFSPITNKIFTSGSDRQIIMWDIDSAALVLQWKIDSSSVGCLSISHDGTRIASAGTSLSIYKIDSDKPSLLHQYKGGHADGVTTVAWLGDNTHVLTAAGGDRHINIWPAGLEASSPLAMGGMIATMTLENGCLSLDVDEQNNVLAVDVQGSVCVWSDPLVPIKSKKRLQSRPILSELQIVNESSQLLLPLWQAAFVPQNNFVLMTAYGAGLLPTLERVSLMNAETNSVQRQVILKRTSTSNILMNGKKENKKTPKQAAVEVDSTSMRLPDLSLMEKEQDKALRESLSAASLGERLAEAQQLEQSLSQAETPTSGASSTPRANSHVQLLIQALQAGDETLLQQCLSLTDDSLIARSVQRLPTRYVVPLLLATTQKLLHRPGQAARLTVWLRAVFMHHAAYLTTVPGLSDRLAPLYRLMESRVQLMPRLCALHGRVSLIVNQMGRRDAMLQDDAATEGGDSPALVYREEDDEEDLDNDSDGVMSMMTEEEEDSEEDEEMEDEHHSDSSELEDMEFE